VTWVGYTNERLFVKARSGMDLAATAGRMVSDRRSR
jgi:hypothetical protein